MKSTTIFATALVMMFGMSQAYSSVEDPTCLPATPSDQPILKDNTDPGKLYDDMQKVRSYLDTLNNNYTYFHDTPLLQYNKQMSEFAHRQLEIMELKDPNCVTNPDYKELFQTAEMLDANLANTIWLINIYKLTNSENPEPHQINDTRISKEIANTFATAHWLLKFYGYSSANMTSFENDKKHLATVEWLTKPNKASVDYTMDVIKTAKLSEAVDKTLAIANWLLHICETSNPDYETDKVYTDAKKLAESFSEDFAKAYQANEDMNELELLPQINDEVDKTLIYLTNNAEELTAPDTIENQL